AREAGDSSLPIMNSPAGTNTNFMPTGFSICFGNVAAGPIDQADEAVTDVKRRSVARSCIVAQKMVKPAPALTGNVPAWGARVLAPVGNCLNAETERTHAKADYYQMFYVLKRLGSVSIGFDKRS